MKTYDVINRNLTTTSSQDENANSSSEYSILPENTASSSSSHYSKLTQHIDQLVNTSSLTVTNQNHIKTQLPTLCERRREPFEIDILQYWSKQCQDNLKLTQLVEVVLAVPATQVSVERAFSALATVLTKLRSKLTNRSLSNILITKLNFELIDFNDIKID